MLAFEPNSLKCEDNHFTKLLTTDWNGTWEDECDDDLARVKS